MSPTRKCRWVRGLLPCMLLAITVFQFAACAAPSYYAQAISGHRDLMRQRKDIAEILNSGSANPELAQRLELALEIRKFAVARLHLPDNAGFTQFVETGREAVTWNVVAAPEFSLTPRLWCFLVSGCVPYRGYFKLQNAEDFAARLAGAGFDTAVSPVIAYSTLGWFDDPLLDTMFRYGDEQLAAVIFHEMAHQELYVSGDALFNESYASFVEQTGLRLWLESSGRESRLPGWLKLQRAGVQLNELLQETRTKLAAIYASGQPENSMREAKSAMFENLRANYRLLVADQWEGHSYFAALFARELNNASLALVNSYRGGSCAFEALYREANRDMNDFQQLAATKARLGKAQRRSWLDQPCEIIASGGDL